MDALRQIEYAGRNCYRSHDKIIDDSAPAFVRSLIRRGHLAPLEFADMSVELVTSRDVMAELTRHRLASFCIESQRYVCMNGEIAFILPCFYRESDEASEFWEFCMADAEQSYHFLLEKGLKPEELMVFGDNQNDISMLELTPNSYAVDHAKPDVKVHAARTCKSVTETLRQFITSQQTDN